MPLVSYESDYLTIIHPDWKDYVLVYKHEVISTTDEKEPIRSRFIDLAIHARKTCKKEFMLAILFFAWSRIIHLDEENAH